MFKIIKQQIKKYPKYLTIRQKVFLWKDSLEQVYFNKIISHFPSHTIRLFLLRKAGARIAKDAAIHSGCKFWNPKGLIIESGSVVGFSCNLDARKGLKIGKNVCLASEVMIWSLHHNYNDPEFTAVGGPVEIGDYAWLCSRCIILPEVKIGTGCVVASGAVITKDVPDYDIVGGIPGKKIGQRDRSQHYNYTPSKYKLHIV
ncbi:MAG: acyltransferase [Candidatus Azobacteroides sp.]|nr:acyltransferase [Candidatus Azobacteroides sp.]